MKVDLFFLKDYTQRVWEACEDVSVGCGLGDKRRQSRDGTSKVNSFDLFILSLSLSLVVQCFIISLYMHACMHTYIHILKTRVVL